MWASPFEKGGKTFAVPHPIAVYTSSSQLHIQGVAHSLWQTSFHLFCHSAFEPKKLKASFPQKILSSFTHPCVVTFLYDFPSSAEHKYLNSFRNIIFCVLRRSQSRFGMTWKWVNGVNFHFWVNHNFKNRICKYQVYWRLKMIEPVSYRAQASFWWTITIYKSRPVWDVLSSGQLRLFFLFVFFGRRTWRDCVVQGGEPCLVHSSCYSHIGKRGRVEHPTFEWWELSSIQKRGHTEAHSLPNIPWLLLIFWEKGRVAQQPPFAASLPHFYLSILSFSR